MSNIEERVVILQFDNSNFERNTKQSIDTLNKLDDSIKKTGSGKSMEGLSKAAKSVDLSKVSKSVDTVNHRMSALGVAGATVIGNLTNSAVNFGKNLLTAIPNQIREGGLTRALNIEQAKFQIEGLKGNWDDTAKAMAQGTITIKEAVNNAVKGTAYGLDEAAKIGSQMMASGITDANVLQKHLQSVAGLAAMTGGSFSDIGRIFAQVAGQGRLMGDQLLQISQRGINAASTIANYINSSKKAQRHVLEFANSVGKGKNGIVMGFADDVKNGAKVTEATIRDLVTAGVIDFETFSNAMNTAFGEHATKANETYTGSLANMKAALSRIGADVQSQKLVNLKNLFNTLTPIIDGIHEALGPMIERINQASVKMTDFAMKTLNKVGVHFGWIKKGADIASKGANGVAKAMGKSSSSVSKDVKKATGVLTISKKEAQAAWDIWNKGTYGNGEARKRNLKAAGLSYHNVQSYVNALIKANFDLDKVNIKVAKSGKAHAKAMDKVGDKAKDAGKGIEKVGEETDAAAEAAEIFANVLITIGNVIKTVVNVVKGFINLIRLGVKIVQTAITPFLRTASGGILSLSGRVLGLSDSFSKWTAKLLENNRILAAVRKGSEFLHGKLMALFGTLKAHISTSETWQRLGTAFMTLLSKIKAGFLSFGKSLANFFRTLGQNKGVQELKVQLSALWDVLKRLLAMGFEKFVSLFEKFVKVVGKLNLGDKIIKGLGQFASGLAKITEKINKVLDPMGKLKKLFGEVDKAQEGIDSKSLTGNVNINNRNAANASDSLSFWEILVKKIKNLTGGKGLQGAIQALKEQFSKLGEALGLGEKLRDADLNSITKSLKDMVKMIVMIKVVKDAGKVASGASQALAGIGTFFTSFAGVGASIKKACDAYTQNTKMKSFGIAVLSLAAILASVALLAKVPTKKLIPAVAAVGVIFALILGILRTITSSTVDNKKLQETAITFVGMGAAMLMISMSVGKFAKMSVGQLVKAGVALAAFMAIFAGMSRFAGSVAKTGATFALMAGSINILIPALMLLAHMKPETLVRGAMAVFTLMYVLAKASSLANKNLKGAAGFLAMATAIGILVPAIMILSMLPFAKALKGVAVVSMVMLALSTAARIAGGTGSSLAAIATMATMMATVAGSLVVLSFIDGKKLLKAAASLSATMLAFAAAGKIASTATNGILLMVAMLAILTGAFALLTKIKTDAVMATATALVSVAAALSLLCVVFSAIPIPAAVQAALALGAFVGILTGVLVALGGISKIPGVNGLLEKGGGLLGKLGSAIGQFVGGIVDGFRKASTKSLSEVGEKLKTFGSQLSTFFGTLKQINDEDIGKFKNITKALQQMTQATAMNDQNGGDSKAGKEKIDELCKTAGHFVDKIKEVISKAEGLDKGAIERIKGVAEIAKTFAEAANEIPETPPEGGSFKSLIVGTKDFKTFVNKIIELLFVVSVLNVGKLKTFKAKVNALKQVAKMVGDFASAANESPSRGINLMEALVGYKDIGEFFKEVASVVSQINDLTIEKGFASKVKSLASATGMLNDMANAASATPYRGGLAQAFVGYQDIGEFAKEVAEVANQISGASFGSKDKKGNYSTFATKVAALKSTAKMITDLGNAAQAIPPTTTSVASIFAGKKDLGKFAEQISTVANKINEISLPDPKGFKAKADAIRPAAAAIKDMATAAAELGTAGGGNGETYPGASIKGLTNFVPEVVNVATKIASANLPEDFSDKAAKFRAAAGAIKAMASAAEAIPKKQTWVGKKLTGDKSLGAFADELKKFMPKLKSAINSTAGVSKDSVGKFKNISSSIRSLAQAANAAGKVKGGSKTQLTALADGMKSYVNKIGKLDTEGLKAAASNVADSVKAVTGALNSKKGSFKKIGSSSMASYVSGLRGKKGAARSAAKGVATSASNALKGKSMKSAGAKVASTFIDGLKSKKDSASKAGSSLAKSAKNGTKGHSAYSSGVNLAQGYINGINSKIPAAYNAAFNLGSQGPKGINNGQQSQSPSKLAYQSGVWLDQGLINGMLAFKSKVYKQGYDIGSTSANAINESMSELDSIDPRITPVMDMSNIRNGVNQIDGMLANAGTVNATLQAQSMMNRQNGSDAATAVVANKLDRIATKLETQETGTTYNIGDVTLDVNSLRDVLTLEDFVSVIRRAKAFA